jgi:hypothetical protein
LTLSGEELYDATIIDSADPMAKKELGMNGVFCRNCLKKDVYESIDVINTMLGGDGLNNPILTITEDCPKLIDQFRNWVGDDCGYPVKDQYDHGIDAFRYIAHFRSKIRFNRKTGMVNQVDSQGEDVAETEVVDFGEDFNLGDSGDTLFQQTEIDNGRDFNERDFDLGF